MGVGGGAGGSFFGAGGAVGYGNGALPNYGIINNFGYAGGLNVMGGVAAAGFGGAGMANGKIIKIEKIYNAVLYEKFMNEFKRMLRKYPHL